MPCLLSGSIWQSKVGLDDSVVRKETIHPKSVRQVIRKQPSRITVPLSSLPRRFASDMMSVSLQSLRQRTRIDMDVVISVAVANTSKNCLTSVSGQRIVLRRRLLAERLDPGNRK